MSSSQNSRAVFIKTTTTTTTIIIIIIDRPPFGLPVCTPNAAASCSN